MQIYVAVYGTLKRGFGNNYLLRNAKYKGFGITSEVGLLYDVGFPYFVPEEYVQDEKLLDVVKPVQVEIYEVDKITLNSLDFLEGYPNHYDRKLINIRKFTIDADNIDVEIFEEYEEITAWIYYIKFIPKYAELLNTNPEYITKLNINRCLDECCNEIEKDKIEYVYWGEDSILNFAERYGNLNKALVKD